MLTSASLGFALLVVNHTTVYHGSLFGDLQDARAGLLPAICVAQAVARGSYLPTLGRYLRHARANLCHGSLGCEGTCLVGQMVDRQRQRWKECNLQADRHIQTHKLFMGWYIAGGVYYGQAAPAFPAVSAVWTGLHLVW